MENAICNLELQVLTKIYSAKKVTKKALAGVSFTLGPGLYGLLGVTAKQHRDLAGTYHP